MKKYLIVMYCMFISVILCSCGGSSSGKPVDLDSMKVVQEEKDLSTSTETNKYLDDYIKDLLAEKIENLTANEMIHKEDGSFTILAEDEFDFGVCVEQQQDRIKSEMADAIKKEFPDQGDIKEVSDIRLISILNMDAEEVLFFESVADVLTDDNEHHLVYVYYLLNGDKTDIITTSDAGK